MYKLVNIDGVVMKNVIRVSDNTSIPFAPANTEKATHLNQRMT
jgi:hypothetical protein